MGRRVHLCLVRLPSPLVQRLRSTTLNPARRSPRCDNPPHAPQLSPKWILVARQGKSAYKTGHNLRHSMLIILINPFAFHQCFNSNARDDFLSGVGKSLGISVWITLPVAAHSTPRLKVVINPTHSKALVSCPNVV